VADSLAFREDLVMRILFIGGAGYVGGLLTPLLAQRHAVRVLDLRPPQAGAEYVAADATDYPALLAALAGIDTVVHAAMGEDLAADPQRVASAVDVNVKSVYLTALAAHHAGVSHLVYLSSLSVYRDVESRHIDESMPPDASDVYGLTKRLGEEICRAAVREYGLSINVLRLAWPTTDDAWPAWAKRQPPELLSTPDGRPLPGTAASDVASAVDAALHLRDGFQAFTVAIDWSGRWRTDRARERLGWSPRFSAAR
jgi:nucleoside-diphosphate-sugar epimerase